MKAHVAALRPLILIFAGFVLVQAVTAAMLFVMKLGLAPTAIEGFYRGSELAMTRPRSLTGLLEVAVPHLLAVPLTLFIVIHLVSWAGVVGREALQLLARVSFALSALGLTAGLGVRYLWPWLSVVKLVAFLGMELTLVAWCVLLFVAFWPSNALSATAA